MDQTPPVSPVTKQHPTRKVDSIAVKDIIKLYKDEIGIDVAKNFKGIDKVEIYECSATTYRFYYPYETAGDGTFYAELQGIAANSKDWEYYRGIQYDHHLAIKHITEKDKVLEIGCGVGSFLEMLKGKAAESVGLELNKDAIKVCQSKGLTVYNELIEDHAAKKTEYYDVVCFFQVLEHISDIKGFLDGALKALRKGGKLIIGVPNNEPYLQRFHKYSTLNLPPHHSGLWNRYSFKKLEEHYPVLLQDVVYPEKGRWDLDAYYRAKKWWNIKSAIKKHTTGEKVLMLLAGIITVPLSLIKHFTTGINTSYIGVVFQKKG